MIDIILWNSQTLGNSVIWYHFQHGTDKNGQQFKGIQTMVDLHSKMKKDIHWMELFIFYLKKELNIKEQCIISWIYVHKLADLLE